MGIYRVEKGGSAPAGLGKGDQVVTGGGTYQITGVKNDGTYTSKLVDAAQTIHNYSGAYDSVKSSIPGGSSRTEEKVSKLESGYTPSDATQKAQAYLEEVQGKKPGAYESKWSAELDALYDKITNREKFQYDVYNDPLYQQYRQQYQTLGRQAMMDTMGQAAALTGGYGSSYGESVGQQQYNAYLQSLNDVVPELYGQAYQQYADEGTQMQNQYSMLLDKENTDYNRYRDTMSDYQNELQIALEQARQAESDDYDRYMNELSYWSGKLSDEQSYAAQLASAQASAGSGSATVTEETATSGAPEFGKGMETVLYRETYENLLQAAQEGDTSKIDKLMSGTDKWATKAQYNALATLLNRYGYNLPTY